MAHRSDSRVRGRPVDPQDDDNCRMPVPNLLTTWSPADPDIATARRETAHRLADALRAASFTVNALLGNSCPQQVSTRSWCDV